jgi:hypothetical protein
MTGNLLVSASNILQEAELLTGHQNEIQQLVRSLNETIDYALDQLPTDRPDFGPTQVRSEDDLVIGRRYRKHYRLFTNVFTLTCRPFYSNGTLWIDVVYDNGERGRESLRDCSIVPYIVDDVERWNDSNWLEDTTR